MGSGDWGMGGLRGEESGGGVIVGTAQSPLRLMTLRDFYDCFLSYQKSYEAVLCVFLLLLLFFFDLDFFLSFSGNL